MPWSGGSFSRTDGTRTGSTVWAQAKAAAVKVISVDHDTHDQDFAAGIDNCLTKDGQNAATGAIDFNGNKLIVDVDGDSSITSDVDDRIDFEAGGADIVRMDGSTAASANFLDLASRATGVAPVIKSRGEANTGLVIQDSNGNEELILASTAGAVNEISITNKATGAAPTIGASGEANIGLTLLDSNGNEGLVIGSTANAVNEVKVTNKAMGVAPTIQSSGESDIGFGLLDSNGNEILIGGSVVSAVNEVTISNAATGNRPKISATGETNVSLDVQPNGSGVIQFLDGNGNEVLKTGAAVASAVNEVTVTNSAAGNAVEIAATGSDTNISLNLVSKGAGTVQANGKDLGPTNGTVIATTSGTAHGFTGIAAGTKLIHFVLDTVSLSGTDDLLVQIGDAGGYETTGYASSSNIPGAGVSSTAGFIINLASAAAGARAIMTLALLDAATNTWVASHSGNRSDAATATIVGGGRKALSGALDRIQITRTGTNTFDSGSVNILYQ